MVFSGRICLVLGFQIGGVDALRRRGMGEYFVDAVCDARECDPRT